MYISGEDSKLRFCFKLKCNQIRTVDKLRLLKVVGDIPDEIIKKVEKAIMIHLEVSESII